MDDVRQLERRTRLASYLAFVAVAAAVCLIALANLRATTPMGFAFLLALAVVYSALGTYGNEAVERSGSFLVALAYFVVQIALGTAIMYVDHLRGASTMILLPLAAQAVTLLPRRWLLAVLAAIVAAFGFVLVYLAGWTALASVLTYVTGVIFVVVFTQIAVSEQRYRREVQRLNVELAGANAKLRDYAVKAEELAIAQERNRMAREIHDGLGHYLTAINIQLEAARTVVDSDRARALDAMLKAQALAKDGLAEVRRSVSALRASPDASRPLHEAVASLVVDSRSAGIRVELALVGEVRPMSPQAEHVLYRAAQEGLTNVRKHSGAKRAWVTLDYSSEGVTRLVVRDDGRGAERAEGGFGLLGVRERSQILGGKVTVTTAPGQGFTLEVEVPA